jgi:hypothetical protein
MLLFSFRLVDDWFCAVALAVAFVRVERVVARGLLYDDHETV